VASSAVSSSDAARPGSRGSALVCRTLALCAGLAACGGEPADLSTEQLAKVVAAKQPTLKVCYDAELERAPSSVTLQFDATIHIAPSGRVSSVAFDPGAAPPPLLTCLRKAISTWTFPRAEDPTHTSLPLIFKPEVVPSGPNLDDVQKMLKDLGVQGVKPAQPSPEKP
jgi:hypothetical protein